MQLKRSDWLYILAIVFISIVTVFDLFTNVGRSANMDGLIHITTAEMFHNAISHGEFPVTWVDGFGNYGFPLGIIAQQLTSYAGAFLIFLVHNPILAYNIVCFIGLLLGNIFFYIFLRKYLPQIPSFAATFLFNFAPYRIINLYIRGAIPEAFSNVFLPLLLLSLYYFVKRKNIFGLLSFAFLIACLAITHPMILLIYAFLFVPYFIFLITVDDGTFVLKNLWSGFSIRAILSCIVAVLIGVGIAGYYVIPLNLELKYMYYGLTKNHLTSNQFMGLRNYFDYQWYYFTKSEIFPRGHVIEAGLLETLSVIGGVILLIGRIWKKRSKYTITLFDYAVVTSLIVIFFTTKYADVFYQHINLLSQIQFPWRMFTAFMFLPPIIIGFFFKRFTNIFLVLLFIVIVSVIRFPQLYGKNYADYPMSSYDFTVYNLHSTVMNTIWTGKTEDYPMKKTKYDIIAGKGSVVVKQIKNSSRIYQVTAETPVTLVDYTFYFPGWHVTVDGQEVPIEFQNEHYRGVITYVVPSGSHLVKLFFTDTKVRFLGKLVSLFFICIFVVLLLFRKRLQLLVYRTEKAKK